MTYLAEKLGLVDERGPAVAEEDVVAEENAVVAQADNANREIEAALGEVAPEIADGFGGH